MAVLELTDDDDAMATMNETTVKISAYTPEQVAAFLNVTVGTIRGLKDRSLLCGILVGDKLRFTFPAIEAYLRKALEERQAAQDESSPRLQRRTG